LKLREPRSGLFPLDVSNVSDLFQTQRFSSLTGVHTAAISVTTPVPADHTDSWVETAADTTREAISMESAAEFFEKFERNAAQNTDAATQPNAVYQFNITGDGGGEWNLDCTKGKTGDFVSTGTHDSPGATITVSAEDWLGMVNGSLNPMQAFMSGKIKIDGDMTLAMSLQQVMNLAQD
jgi:putative sterol carrier protein